MKFKNLLFLLTPFLPLTLFSQTRVDSLLTCLLDRVDTTVLVVAHRGDWRNAPENSLRAFDNCISMGVDMIETDLKMSKDSVLVIMHDRTIDRTTDASGSPSDYTWNELSQMSLKNGLGRSTHHQIPSLEAVLEQCRGKILINLDKGYDYFNEVLPLLEKTGTCGQVVIKSGHPLAKVLSDYPGLMEKVIYMPIISLDKPNAGEMVAQYLTVNPVAIECCFTDYTPQVAELLQTIRNAGVKIWLNSLWSSLNAGHDDERAMQGEPDQAWGWLVGQGATLIQTDRPQELIHYLDSAR